MNMWRPVLLVPLVLLSLLAGCARLDTIRLGQDRPGDINALLELRQYERAEQLLNDYPYLDTPGQREMLHERIAEYEQSAVTEAEALESAENLYRALEVLDQALVNLPHSTVLNDYRRRLARRRDARLRDNQRRQLVSRAEYLVSQQAIYEEQLNLDPPGFGTRVTHTLLSQEARNLDEKLLACGHEAMEDEDLGIAERCLQMARTLEDSPAVQAELASLAEKQAAYRRTQAMKEQIRQVRQEKKQAITRRNRTQELLAKTGEALDANDLLAARNHFGRIPARENNSQSVNEMRDRLDRAIGPVVEELLDRGDRQYRADKVDRAISSWSIAQELDPENTAIRERLERARKVLARLEELKSRQQ